ncbi:retrovirus-related pol polyprotein from transposon TNT 1-94 [Tanacetum coccineum]
MYMAMSHVYYIEGLGHSLFSVGQFCDGDLEVAFRSKTCYVHNLEGDDLLTSARELNLYTISISDMAASSPMVESINGKKYILVIVDDYSRYMCVYFLRTKDEAPDIIKKFIAQVQLNFKVQIQKVRTDNGSEFKNAILQGHYEKLEGFRFIIAELERSWKPSTLRLMNSRLWLLNITIWNPRQTASITMIHQKSSLLYHQKKIWIICSVQCTRNTLRKDDLEYPSIPLHKQLLLIKTHLHHLQSSLKTIKLLLWYPLLPISHDEADEFVQEDSTDLGGNTLLSPYHTPMFEEAESSSTAEDPSNMHTITHFQPSTHTWTKAHPLEQVIGDPSRPVMTRSRLNTDPEVCMYALTMSTTEPKNIKEAMSDHS